MDSLRACFPVCDRIAYLNAGSDGPLPEAAVAAARAMLDDELLDGRTFEHFGRRAELGGELRAAFAEVLGAPATEVAVTTSTTEGLARVLVGLDLGPGDEIVTAEDEHPGLVVPLRALQARGVTVRAVPFADLADAVRPSTTLVACSHVNWFTGALAPAALAEVDVPVVLDGAQGLGAVPTDVRALGCSAYAAPGQKWLCGADGTGALWLEPAFMERVRPALAASWNLEDPSDAWGSELRADASRHDTFAIAAEVVVTTLAAIGVLAGAGWEHVLERGPALADRLVEGLIQRGLEVVPRDRTTLVTWHDADPVATHARLTAAGVSVRHLPGMPHLRASTGAWNDESDLERLLDAL